MERLRGSKSLAGPGQGCPCVCQVHRLRGPPRPTARCTHLLQQAETRQHSLQDGRDLPVRPGPGRSLRGAPQGWHVWATSSHRPARYLELGARPRGADYDRAPGPSQLILPLQRDRPVPCQAAGVSMDPVVPEGTLSSLQAGRGRDPGKLEGAVCDLGHCCLHAPCFWAGAPPSPMAFGPNV